MHHRDGTKQPMLEPNEWLSWAEPRGAPSASAWEVHFSTWARPNDPEPARIASSAAAGSSTAASTRSAAACSPRERPSAEEIPELAQLLLEEIGADGPEVGLDEVDAATRTASPRTARSSLSACSACC